MRISIAIYLSACAALASATVAPRAVITARAEEASASTSTVTSTRTHTVTQYLDMVNDLDGDGNPDNGACMGAPSLMSVVAGMAAAAAGIAVAAL